MRQVSVNTLKIGDVLGKTIYSSNGRVLLGKGVKLTPLYISKMRDMGITIVYIEDDRFEDVVPEDIIDEDNRRQAIEIIEQASQAIRVGKDIDDFHLRNMVSKIVEEIMFKKDILVNMMDIRSKDNHTFAHSVNVCVLATVLGKVMLLDKEKLETLAIGALLHDIGMVHLPQSLLEKHDSLTEEEEELVKTHTKLGFEELRKRKDLNLVVAHIAFQHHEYIDGTGYPRQLRGDEIHPLAQIVAIANLYDKLTSDHSGMERIMPHEGCEVLMGLVGKAFPLEPVRLFLRNIAAYPSGSTVRLNTGEIGVVVNQNPSIPARPVVRVFDDMKFEVGQAKEYNMVEKRTIFITEVLS
ncbi:putative domain HDIG-containing protein [Desulfitobacterium dichloroeliminans LMG P-21439]|uniref:Putative domain HDIG-containing protein n=1 Tax=Desulfitobacterium dichloroeliminans (strain LMG P-21439 / DCA1) TaxID=871963 RepID=L0F991_DESDL|nr:HD-GYP domain-containing protein [Desulfitobacterium dichloroeliminans]AGA69575.1 putative domain HDIG-containing protein [Desulfitobacterium dichloroeliminans LMG P-21439]